MAGRSPLRRPAPSCLMLLLLLPPLCAALSERQPSRSRGASVSVRGLRAAVPGTSLAEHQQLQVSKDPPVTSTTSTSWGQRMKHSVGDFLLGIVLVIFSVPILWVNEKRVAQMESLIAFGRRRAKSVKSVSPPEPSDRCKLVHVQGELTRGLKPVRDEQFEVELEDNCLRFESEVEVFQVIEHEHKEEREKFGGGKETITTYTYSQAWSTTYRDSSGYRHSTQRLNTKPDGLEPGTYTQDCPEVELGQGFLLTEQLVRQSTQWIPAHGRLPSSIKLRVGGQEFKRPGPGEHYYSCPERHHAPVVGDARVCFKYVQDHPATVLALQVEGSDATRDTFVPYRLISRGWFGLSEEEEKARLLQQGRKTSADLADEARFRGRFACLCCACSLISSCFTGTLTPQLYHLLPGSCDLPSCFAVITSRNRTTKWIIRFTGWLLMFIGTYSLFSPFLTLLKVVPFLGPLASTLGGYLIWFVCFLVTLVLASTIIVIAYLFYHPLLALAYALFAAVIVGGVYCLAALL